MVQVMRFYFTSAEVWMQNIVTPHNLEGGETKSFKVESNLQPYETYSSPVFVHGCKHLDLVYDLGREADSVLLPSRSHTSLSIFIPHEATS